MISQMRIITMSTAPPAKPEMAPYSTPMTTMNIVDTTPMTSDMRVPIITRTHRSRPRLSVPKG